MKYSDIKDSFDIKENVKEITFNGKEIKIYQSLSSKDIYDLIEITMQQSKQNGIFNSVLLETNFAINVIMLLTDIEFDENDMTDRFKLYDDFVNSGLYTEIGLAFPDFNLLAKTFYDTVEKVEKFEISTAGIIKNFIQDLPTQMEAVAEILNSFDPNKFEEVKKFAEAANGNRPIN